MLVYTYDKFGRYQNTIAVEDISKLPKRCTNVKPEVLDTTSVFNFKTNLWGVFQVPEQTEEEKALIAKQALEAEMSARKQTGKPYELNGIVYQVPFTVEDATGMLQVKAAFDLGLHFTNFHFSNGVIMPLHSSEFLDFALWFANERNNFFIGD